MPRPSLELAREGLPTTLKPTHQPSGKEPRAIDLFTDREEPQRLFAQVRESLAPDRDCSYLLRRLRKGGWGVRIWQAGLTLTVNPVK